MFKKPDLHQPTVTYNNQRKNLFIIKYGLTKDEYTQAKKMQRLNHDAWQKKIIVNVKLILYFFNSQLVSYVQNSNKKRRIRFN